MAKIKDEIRKIAEEVADEKISEIPPTEFPKVQKVEVSNFPPSKAPVVNVAAPVVKIEKSDPPIVNVETPDVIVPENKSSNKILEEIRELLNRDNTEHFENLERAVRESGGVFRGGAVGPQKKFVMDSTGKVINPSVSDPTGREDTPETYESTSFTSEDSPATLDFNTDLGRNATEFTVINDGAGDFTVSVLTTGAVFGDEHTMKNGETYSIDNISVDSLRITHVADSAYRAIAI